MHPGFTANSRCSASPFPSALYRASCAGSLGRPTKTWSTFLRNHVGQMVSMDLFTVPTITMRILFVLIVLEHDRRKVLHFNVTEHPTGAWTAQQIVEAFADREAAHYLIRDRDSRYSAEVRLRIQSCVIDFDLRSYLDAASYCPLVHESCSESVDC